MGVETGRHLRHQMTDVGGGVRLHSVTTGEGSPVILLHGFPQTWREWRHLIAPLSRSHTVVAVDLKGGGHSDKPVAGYDKVTMAGELDRLRSRLGLNRVSVIGHDVGGMVAYAWAAAYPDAVERVAIVDVPIPGVRRWEKIYSDPAAWHFAFHQKRDLPETLIRGNERAYVKAFMQERMVNMDSVTDEDIQVCADAMAQPGGLRGMLEWYRAFPQDVIDNRISARTALDMPVLAIGGDRRWGDRMAPMLQEFATDVRGAVIADCGHWVPEERPTELLAVLEPFLESL